MAIKKSNFACVYMRNISQNDSGERCGPWASSFFIIIIIIITSAYNARIYLFFQVDLVFEAYDKGFWAAVKNFMDSTKIPIILTSNDTSLSQTFEGKFEHYRFKGPSIVRSPDVRIEFYLHIFVSRRK
jgi:hypothetical protein